MDLHDLHIDDAKLASFCRANGIKRLELFGSAVGDDFTAASDVDVIVEFAGVDNLNLLELGRMQGELTAVFGRQVHLHTPDMIHPYMRTRIRRLARTAYAA